MIHLHLRQVAPVIVGAALSFGCGGAGPDLGPRSAAETNQVTIPIPSPGQVAPGQTRLATDPMVRLESEHDVAERAFEKRSELDHKKELDAVELELRVVKAKADLGDPAARARVKELTNKRNELREDLEREDLDRENIDRGP